MGTNTLDSMIEYAVGELLSGSDARRRALVRNALARWPREPALRIIFALTSAASMIEDTLGPDGETHRAHVLAYKFAALLSADVYALERQGHAPVSAREVMRFWHRTDPYFLRL